MKKFYIALCAAIVALGLWSCNNAANVVVVKSAHTIDAEIEALCDVIEGEGRVIEVVDIDQLGGKLGAADVVIYHRCDTAAIDQTELALKEVVLPYVQKGGQLMLTMDGVRLLNEWGVEPQQLQVEYQDATDYGSGRAVGFHGYREHPIYDGLHGGAYVWKATVDNFARNWGFSGANLPQAEGAKVVGVNWAYIRYHENRKIVWETPVGKGNILAVGGYLYYSEPNVNRSTLEIFTNNSVDYLAGVESPSEPRYWPFDSVRTEQVENLPIKDVKAKVEKAWTPESSEMEHTRKAEDYRFWNVAGKQVLAMAYERGRIDEIWMHPVMVMRDLNIGVQYKGSDKVEWMHNVYPTVTKRPESLERLYELKDGATLREFVVASLDDPMMAIRYDWTGENIEKVFVTYTSNLRLMWPYSLDATGTLFYGLGNDNRQAVVYDRAKELNLVTLFDKAPAAAQCGEYEFRHLDVAKFDQTAAKYKQVAFLYEFEGAEQSVNLYIAGGEEGVNKSAKLIGQNVGKVEQLNKDAKAYFDSFDVNMLAINSSDEEFNKAYRWALISTDKFFCHTPSLGKSMQSGYFSTYRGWNGGHAVSGRPGYAWYFGRDTECTGIGMINYGDYDKIKDILITFGKYQDPDGKVYHELTTSGSAHYDASDATPLYVVLAGRYLQASGDLEFIRQEWHNIKQSMDFCYSTDTDGDLLIENTNVGHGWQECYQLYGAHTEVYLATAWAEALRLGAEMADLMGEPELAEKYRKDCETVVYKINNEFWNEELQFYNHGLMKDGTYQEQKCVLGGTPVWFEVFDEERKAILTAENFASKYYSTNWGVKMVGYDSPYYAIGGYQYGGVWPFHTGHATVAEYKAGLYSQAFRHAYSQLSIYDAWDYGNIPEVIQGDKFQFTGICSHQQWSSSMPIYALIEGLAGVEAFALENRLALAPAFPVDWKDAEVKNIRMADKYVNMAYVREADSYNYTITGQGVNIDFTAVLPLATKVLGVEVNGAAVEYEVAEKVQSVQVALKELVALNGEAKVVVKTEGGVGVLLNFEPLEINEPDTHIKIEKERYCKGCNAYVLTVAGMPKDEVDVEIFVRGQIKGVEGATLKSVDGEKATITVQFPKSKKEPFVSKEVKVKF